MQTIVAIIYDISSGKILRKYYGPDNLASIQCGINEAVLFGEVDDVKNYISQGAITPRQTMPITLNKIILSADGVDNIAISGAPNGATITAKNTTTGDTASGPCANPDYFSTNVKGQVTLTVSCWPYLDWSTTITAQ